MLRHERPSEQAHRRPIQVARREPRPIHQSQKTAVRLPPLERQTYYASLVHDALYQFLLDGLPFKRWQAARCFLRLMDGTGFAPRYLYWAAVRLLGWVVGRAAG